MERHRSGHNGADSKFVGLVSFSSDENPVFMRGHAVRKTEYFAVLSVSSFQKFFLCKKHQENGGLTYTEAYRSGHNGPDSKHSFVCPTDCHKIRLTSAFAPLAYARSKTRISQFSRNLVIWLLPLQFHMERYRSGHNGADSKSVWEQSHAGSNPALSARKKPRKHWVYAVFSYLRAKRPVR